MHILVVPSAYPTEDEPLRSTFFKEQALALKEYGNDVGVIYSETRRVSGININSIKKNHFQIENIDEKGLNTIRLHGWNILTMRNSLGINLWVKQSIKLFKKYIKIYGNPDILHVHCGLYGGIVAKKIKEIYEIPYIITEHSSLVMNELINDNDKKILIDVYNNANYLISVSKKLKKVMEKYTTTKIEVIPNIVDTEIFNFKESIKEKFSFVSVSFLKNNKNVDLTIQAFSDRFKGNKDIELIIAGDGTEKQNLINLSKKLGIDEQVRFLGAVTRNDLPKVLEKSNVFVLPSKFETFGVVYIEAMACGLPIIVTKCGGPEDFFDSKYGYMIDVGDVEGLGNAMEKSVDEYNKFNKKEISTDIKQMFSKEVIVKKIVEVYSKVNTNNVGE